MKKSSKYPGYRLLNDGTIISPRSKMKLNSFVTVVKNGKRRLMDLEDFKKEFDIESDEIDTTIKQASSKPDEQEEQWRSVNDRDWMEVSTLGRVRINGVIEPMSRNMLGHPYIRCGNIYSDDKANSFFTFVVWKEVIKFKFPEYDYNKVIHLDGDRNNCHIDNLADARNSTYWYNKKAKERAKERYKAGDVIDQEKTITIKLREFEAIKEYNDILRLESDKKLNELKKENEHLRKQIKYRLASGL